MHQHQLHQVTPSTTTTTKEQFNIKENEQEGLILILKCFRTVDCGIEAIFSHSVLVVQTWWRFFSSFQYNTRPRPDFHIIVSTVSLDNSDMGHSLIKPIWCEISPKMWSSVHDMQATITCCACQLVSTAY